MCLGKPWEIQWSGTDSMLCYVCVKAFDVIKLSATKLKLNSSFRSGLDDIDIVKGQRS